MHAHVLDDFGRPDSVEWRHRRYTVSGNSRPTGPADRYFIWDRRDQLVGEVPSLQAARRWIDALSNPCPSAMSTDPQPTSRLGVDCDLSGLAVSSWATTW
jgi:hypothetical protein